MLLPGHSSVRLHRFTQVSMLKASLPLFDFPELRDITDAWWTGLGRHLVRAGVTSAPTRLERPQDLDTHWLQGSPLLSQTCGYGLLRLRHRVQLVATPCFNVPGSRGDRTGGMVLVHDHHPASDPRELYGTHCAIDRYSSQFGYNALRALVAPLADEGRFFKTVRVTGNMRNSVLQVHRREVDVCAVDSVTYALLARYAPGILENVRILCHLPPAPAPPYITHKDAHLPAIQAGLEGAFADPDLANVRASLFLGALVRLPMSQYSALDAQVRRARELGFKALR
ncbi:MAG: phosphate/phosphite/phosphonate ABC transporter substrate-binding protein [Candidatus Competibacterales bacterium]